MKRLLTKKGRIITLVAFILLAGLGAFLSIYTRTNYDMRKYLPADSKTKIAMDILEDEFGKSSMIQVMISDVSDWKTVKPLARKIEEVKHVKTVTWIETINSSPLVSNEDKERFYKDNKVLLIIEFDEDDYSLKTGAAISEIKKLVSEFEYQANYRGAAINNDYARDFTKRESILILVVVVPICIVILFLAATSWLEPVVILANLGVAILINMGTNFIMPSISFITIAIATVLQLAMSLDYSLFLVHRYYERRDEGFNVIDAASLSMKDSLKSVTASAFTTIVGFLALSIMRYTIGLDIGLTLTKAILISYLVTIFLLPSLLVIFDKPLLKLRHKRLLPEFRKLTQVLSRGRFILIGGLVVIAGLSIWLQTKANYMYGDTPNKDPKTVLFQDQVKISDTFGPFQPVVILYHKDDRHQIKKLVKNLETKEHVMMVESYETILPVGIPESMITPEQRKLLEQQFKGKGDFYRMIVLLDTVVEDEQMYLTAEMILKEVSQVLGDDKAYVLGIPTATTEIKTTVRSDGILVQLVSALAIALVIGILLQNFFVPLLLVALIEISIFINVSISAVMGSEIAYIGYLIITALQLGATIDYAVLLTSRYQEFRKEYDKNQALTHAMAKSAPAIITSAVVLATAGFAEMMLSQLEVIKEIGVLVGRGALLSGFLVLIVLPSLLLTFDKWILAASFETVKNKVLKNKKPKIVMYQRLK